MEQHPVPQNVTTFQFRLIGDMTLKQFGYLAGGAILAFICYKSPLPFFLSWPLTILFAFAGFGFAFMPIEERPMDVWVLSFLRSVYSPTQYVWTRSQKNTASLSPPPITAPPAPSQPPPKAPAQTPAFKPKALDSIVISSPAAPPPSPPPTNAPSKNAALQSLFSPTAAPATVVTESQKPAHHGWFDWIGDAFGKKHAAPQNTPIPQPAAPSVSGKHIDMTPEPPVRPIPQKAPQVVQQTAAASNPDDKVKQLEDELVRLRRELQEKEAYQARMLELQKQAQDAIMQKDRIEKELIAARQKLQSRPAATPVFKPAGVVMSPQSAGPSIRIIAPNATVGSGLPRLTTFPNVVTGIIKDSEGGLLPGVLVTVRDKDGVPLRALKSNKLGQFAASTPLPQGIYIIEVEDPRGRFVFDRAQVTLNGAVLPAIEIIAKSQKQLSREKLQKEIFGSQTQQI